MDSTPARSLAGAARRSRRLQGTPSGHTGSATTASGSPYARPTLKRDSSSQTLAALESGDSGAGSSRQTNNLDRRKSVGGSEGIFGRVRRGLGWLVGKTSEATMAEGADEAAVDSRKQQQDDEESMLTGSTRPRTRALPATIPRESSNLAQALPKSAAQREYGNTPSILSGDIDGDESSKKLRTSHSTLNLPRRTSPPKSTRKPHSSTGTLPSRALSPGRPPPIQFGLPESQESSQAKGSIFASGPASIHSHRHLNGNSTLTRGSVSPGGMSQYAQASQTTSGTSSAFGLQSQSPFRAGGHTARSPDLAALNISSGLARSPSLPAEKLLSLQRRGSRLYPYQRSPSILSGFARPSALPTSYSVNSSLATGSKRDFGAMSMSPPKESPGPQAYYRRTPSGLNASPTNTDFGSDFSHRSKRQRVAWNPEKGFITTDADGNPLRDDAPPAIIPKNEAERILERLENIRRPQVDGLRSSSPRRLNVPLPTSTPGKGSIFATRISSSQTEPTLAGYAISPYARRQQAYREERALRRDIINSRGGLGEHLRAANMELEYAASQGPDGESEQGDAPRSEVEGTSNIDEEEQLPLPTPNRRGTRQRTRELSVLSENEMQQDDPSASLRRSTRIRKKSAAEDAQSPQRERKSAKSPPPTESKRSSGRKKNLNASDAATDKATQSEGEMEEDPASRGTSPQRPRSPNRNKTIKSRARSPVDASRNPTIDQVITSELSPEAPSRTSKADIPTPKPSAREQRLIATQSRKTRSFSAKDDAEEDLEVTSSVTEQPKLKLPNSVFANRFSFGRSPSSSLLASPSAKGAPTSAALANYAANTDRSTAQQAVEPLPKLSLPSSTYTSVPAQTPTSATTLSLPTGTVTSASSKVDHASSTTGTPAGLATVPVTSSQPLFAFKAPATSAPAVVPAKEESAPANPTKPSFSFAPTSSTPPPSAPPTEKPASSFTFGQAPTKRKPEEAAPSFNFGRAAVTPAPDSTPVIDLTKPSNPFAAFPTASSTANDTNKDVSATKTNPLAFGAPSPTAPALTAPPANDVASPANPATTAASPIFKFGGATPSVTPSLSAFGQPKLSEGDGMQSSPPPPVAGTSDKTTSGPFSPVIPPSKAPSFSFGQPVVESSGAVATAQTPSFTFGAQGSSQNEAKSRSASPFNVGAPSQPFSFGSSTKEDTAKPATPSFSFGAPATAAKDTEKAASSGFTFGAASPPASSSTTPAFSFGGSKPATTNPFGTTAPAMQSSGSAFGSTQTQSAPAFGQAAANGASGTPTFNFGAQSNISAPSFSFGATTPAASGSPAFAFGGSAAAPAQPFAFGSSSAVASPAAGVAVPSFNFSASGVPGSQVGSPAGTPTGAGPPGGSFFSVGAGDATSPNKARRPVKPLRRPR